MLNEVTPRDGSFQNDPGAYLSAIRSELTLYDAFQDAIAAAVGSVMPGRVLSLGAGAGETARRVLRDFPSAALASIDEIPEMVQAASRMLSCADLRADALQDTLPRDGFDAVVSALAVHHLPAGRRAELFRWIAAILRPSGRFVLGDIVVPEHPNDAAIALEPGGDLSGRLAAELDRLSDAGLSPHVAWSGR
ncbi:MAG: class I SAM-dependent methyltransferase [Nocardioidaceae bacterium]